MMTPQVQRMMMPFVAARKAPMGTVRVSAPLMTI